MTIYPKLVSVLTNRCEAWIVGSAAHKEDPRDYDLYIPFEFSQCGMDFTVFPVYSTKPLNKNDLFKIGNLELYVITIW